MLQLTPTGQAKRIALKVMNQLDQQFINAPLAEEVLKPILYADIFDYSLKVEGMPE